MSAARRGGVRALGQVDRVSVERNAPALDLKATAISDGVRVEVRVVPRAAKTRITGLHDGCLKIALATPPVDNAANAALLSFVAEALGVRAQDVELVRGHRSRAKTLVLRGIGVDAVRALVPPAS